jgi:hypothetical protein
MMEAENNILMFSGPTQNCGKTLVSTTLAALVAQVGRGYYWWMPTCVRATFTTFFR